MFLSPAPWGSQMTSKSSPNARAEASRRNGARSRGPVSAAGRAAAARNALKHGLRANRVVLLNDEDQAEFLAFAQALHADLAPQGALQEALVARIALALWRTRRSDRIEAGLLTYYLEKDQPRTAAGPDFGLAIIRDGNGPRALDTLMRYRGSIRADLHRALATLKALQADAAATKAPGQGGLPPVDSAKRTRNPL
jgi:hypothetical protein